MSEEGPRAARPVAEVAEHALVLLGVRQGVTTKPASQPVHMAIVAEDARRVALHANSPVPLARRASRGSANGRRATGVGGGVRAGGAWASWSGPSVAARACSGDLRPIPCECSRAATLAGRRYCENKSLSTDFPMVLKAALGPAAVWAVSAVPLTAPYRHSQDWLEPTPPYLLRQGPYQWPLVEAGCREAHTAASALLRSRSPVLESSCPREP